MKTPSLQTLQTLFMVMLLWLILAPGVKGEDYPIASNTSPEVSRTTAYTPEQLNQMLAPIALYPDQLVTQILMAATYPLDVVEAARWLRKPENAALKGDQLEAALLEQPWDPSVKALILFPDIIEMMDANLQWVGNLGDAFIGQQADVMDEIQRLRQRALAAGTLQSTPSQTVTAEDNIVTIEPANPEVVYVPIYDPTYVYGRWPYPDYPPYYFTPYYYPGTPVIHFATAIFITKNIFFFHHTDFRHRRIHLDDHRFRFLNRGHPPIKPGIWAHDPAHRRNVPHHAPGLRSRGRDQITVPTAQRPFRGFDDNQAGSPSGRGRSSGRIEQQRIPAAPSVTSPLQQIRPDRDRTSGRGRSSGRIEQQRIPAAPSVTRPLPQIRPDRTSGPGRSSGHIERRQFVPQSQIRQRTAPVFESHRRGPEVRFQSERGRSSRSEMNISGENRSFNRGEFQRGGSSGRGGGGSDSRGSGRSGRGGR